MFGPKLKGLRERAGLSQRALADRAGVSLRAVSSWEQGAREPSWSNVLALAAALGVDCRAFQADGSERPATPAPRGRPRTADPVPLPGVAFDRVTEVPAIPQARPKKGRKK